MEVKAYACSTTRRRGRYDCCHNRRIRWNTLTFNVFFNHLPPGSRIPALWDKSTRGAESACPQCAPPPSATEPLALPLGQLEQRRFAAVAAEDHRRSAWRRDQNDPTERAVAHACSLPARRSLISRRFFRPEAPRSATIRQYHEVAISRVALDREFRERHLKRQNHMTARNMRLVSRQ